MTAKIAAACDARRDPATVIIGRSDARGVTDLDDCLTRLRAYRDAGADWPNFPLGLGDTSTGGEGGIEVNVRFDEGRHHQVATGVQIIGAQGRRFGLTGNIADQAVFQVQLMQAFLVAQAGVDDVHQANPLGDLVVVRWRVSYRH